MSKNKNTAHRPAAPSPSAVAASMNAGRRKNANGRGNNSNGGGHRNSGKRRPLALRPFDELAARYARMIESVERLSGEYYRASERLKLRDGDARGVSVETLWVARLQMFSCVWLAEMNARFPGKVGGSRVVAGLLWRAEKRTARVLRGIHPRGRRVWMRLTSGRLGSAVPHSCVSGGWSLPCRASWTRARKPALLTAMARSCMSFH